MNAPHYVSDTGDVTLHHGKALDVLRELPDQTVNCCVTSPPYFGLRDYGVDGQYGLEDTPVEYVENLRALFAEVRRVLTDDGTLWLNLGDSYAGKANGGATFDRHRGGGHKAGIVTPQRNMLEHAPYKSMLGIPWRVALALVDDAWTLRNDVIWSKPNAMPESVTDRLSCRHEHVFLFTKSPRYWFDLDPIREPLSFPEKTGHSFGGSRAPDGKHGDDFSTGTYQVKVSRRDSFARDTKETIVPGQSSKQHREDRPNVAAGTPLGRNPGDVWNIPTQPFTESHFAVMPRALAERAILAGCKPGGTVLDPFSGSGTTGWAATKHGRRYVGIDLNAEYLDLSLRTRFAQPGLDLIGDGA